MRSTIALFISLALLANPSLAQDRTDPDILAGTSDFAFLAQAKTATPFFKYDEPCPQDNAACRLGAEVPAGDVLILLDPGEGADEPFYRAFWRSAPDAALIQGYVRRDDVAWLEAPSLSRADWMTNWAATVNPAAKARSELKIFADEDGEMRFDAASFIVDEEGNEIGEAPHLNLSGGLAIDGQTGRFADPGGKCRLTFKLAGPYLLVEEPDYGCGGASNSVTLAGLYRRGPAGTAPAAPQAAVPQPPATAESATSASPAAVIEKGFEMLADSRRSIDRESYKTTNGKTVTLESCRADCAADAKCAGFTLRNDAPTEAYPTCELMSAVGSESVAAKGFTTGLKRR